MADIFSKEQRSRIMSKIRGKNNKAELLVFRFLRQNKIYFQRHYSKASGSPDIALPRKKKAVFIDGGFWHGRDLESRREKMQPFWIAKIERNIARDARQRSELRNAGWHILQIWADDVTKKSTRDRTLTRIKAFLAPKSRAQ